MPAPCTTFNPDALRRVRLARGMSVAELSRRSGCTARSIAFIESGDRSPRISTLSALAVALGVAVTDLMVEDTQ